METPKTVLRVTGLHTAYGQSEVLHGISFEARANETVAIMGRNGMGKTTLFKSLIGMLPLKSGRIEVSVPFDSSTVAANGKMKPTNPGIRGRLRFEIEGWNQDAG